MKYLPGHFIKPEDKVSTNFTKKGGTYDEKDNICHVCIGFGFGWM